MLRSREWFRLSYAVRSFETHLAFFTGDYKSADDFRAGRSPRPVAENSTMEDIS